MNVKELRENLTKIENDDLEVFCANLLPFLSEETANTGLMVEMTRVFSVQKVASLAKYDSEGNLEESIVLGLYPIPRNFQTETTEITVADGEQ